MIYILTELIESFIQVLGSVADLIKRGNRT
jgi:hypothetical protein